ncbi:MAG: hypothetical protein AAB440_00520 [Patescibacteria group bacterium]
MQPSFNEGKPFPIPPEKVRDLKEDISRLMAGTYEIPATHTFVNLCAYMHTLTNQLTAQGLSDEAFSKALNEEFQDAVEALKPEKNALLAIFTSQIWNESEFVEDRARLIRYNGMMTQKLNMLGALFVEACIRWIESPEAKSPPYASMITRFKEIVGFSESKFPEMLSERIVMEVTTSGMSTAEIAAANLASIVMSKCEELENQGTVVSRDKVLTAIQRAYRNIGVMLARMNQNVSVPIMDELWSDPSYFELREEGGEYVLYLLPERLPDITIDDGKSVWKTMRYGETTSCPAMYAVGEHSAVVPEFFKTAVELIGSANDFPQK